MLAASERRGHTTARELLLSLWLELGLRTESILPLLRSAQEARRRVVSLTRGKGYVKGVFLSSEARRKGTEKVAVSRSLDGKLVKHRVGAPLEKSYHYTVVGPHSMKCTCESALNTATRADRAIEEYARRKKMTLKEQHPFSKRVICKHTVALLDELLSGEVDLAELEKTLKIALAGYAISKKKRTKEVAAILQTILSSV